MAEYTWESGLASPLASYDRSARESNTLYLGKDLMPGLLVSIGDGARSFNLRLEQEDRTFSTFIYFKGYRPVTWKFDFELWTQAQLDRANVLYQKYGPGPIKSLPELKAITVTNAILKRLGFLALLLQSITPPLIGQGGVYHYSLVMHEPFRPRFPPAPATGAAKKGLAFDMEQQTKRAINPKAELEAELNRLRGENPGYFYKAPTATELPPSIPGLEPLLSPETYYSPLEQP